MELSYVATSNVLDVGICFIRLRFIDLCWDIKWIERERERELFKFDLNDSSCWGMRTINKLVAQPETVHPIHHHKNRHVFRKMRWWWESSAWIYLAWTVEPWEDVCHGSKVAWECFVPPLDCRDDEGSYLILNLNDLQLLLSFCFSCKTLT